MVTWLFLTAGIFLGMHWAYAVLGWGGYWGWDPVENASFMPWLTGTAFLHSVMMQEKKGMMKSWNVWLIFSTFLLTLLGTLLTRAGLVSSVHAFAQSSIGTWFVVFMGIVLAVCIFTYVLQRSHLKSEQHLESLVSRESSFLFNNLVLLTACFVILWGTLFPILSEYVVGNKVTVGAPFYNRVAIPIGLFLLFLTGVGPLLPWRATSLKSIRAQLRSACHRALGNGDCLPGGGREAVERRRVLHGRLLRARGLRGVGGGDDRHSLRVSARSGRHLAADRAQPGCRHLAADAAQHAALRRLHHSHRRGDCGHRAGRRGLQQQRRKANWACTTRCRSGPTRWRQVGVTQDSNLNYNSEYAMLDVYSDGKKQFQMTPEKRVYLASDQPQTMVAIHSLPSWDLYVVYEGTNPDTGQPDHQGLPQSAGRLDLGGLVILIFGTFVALVPSLTPGHGLFARACDESRSHRAGTERGRLMGTPSRLTFWFRSLQALVWLLRSASRWAQPTPARATTT